jgi:hypothetical protein
VLTSSKNGICHASSSIHVSKLCLLLHQAQRTFPSLGGLTPQGHQNCRCLISNFFIRGMYAQNPEYLENLGKKSHLPLVHVGGRQATCHFGNRVLQGYCSNPILLLSVFCSIACPLRPPFLCMAGKSSECTGRSHSTQKGAVGALVRLSRRR